MSDIDSIALEVVKEFRFCENNNGPQDNAKLQMLIVNALENFEQENQKLREVIDMALCAIHANPDLHAEFAKTNHTALMELMVIAQNKEV